MDKRRWVMWEGLGTASMERCILAQSERGYQLSGLILRASEGLAYGARYSILLDNDWMTQAAEIEVENGKMRRLTLERDAAGTWLVDGRAQPELTGCADVDLEWSPSTNSLPIRRLAMAEGRVETVSAAWVRFPSLAVQPLRQTYERIARRRYRYRAGDFMADVEVDDDALVTRYGETWVAVAAGSRS